MNRRELRQLDRELREYLESMTSGMGRRERRTSMATYVTGLLLDGERKSIEPIAARLVDDPAETEAMRQRLQECVVISAWSDVELWTRLGRKLDAELPEVEAFVIDDTGFPKKGVHSVGVARQYSGTLGRIDNCQIAMSLHLAGERGSGCIGMQIYLPELWAKDTARRKKAGVPSDVAFQEKWRIALGKLDAALEAGVRKHVTLADAGYGDVGEFRAGLDERGLEYVVGVSSQAVVWPPGSKPKLPKRKPVGRPPTSHRDERHPPISMADLAKRLRYRQVSWREGSRGWQASRFAAARIRTAHKHSNGEPPGKEQWLLCEWPAKEPAPTKYWLSTLPANAPVRELVRLAKLRWRIERDYQEMKQELGLDHFEGRTWRGFHHHATLCSVAHGFLALRRALSPPEQTAVDAAHGPPPPPAGAPALGRLLSAVPSTP
jgi:SRSO17 transposase